MARHALARAVILATMSGFIIGADDMGSESVILYPGDQRFILSAMDWPRTEGPTDLTAG